MGLYARIPGSIKIGSGIQKLTRRIYRDTERMQIA
jgi:hypothetical protein